MSEKYKFGDPEGMYFVTSTVVGWVDVFTRPELKHIVIDSLRYCQKEKGLIPIAIGIHAWCLMSSHLHMIISTYKGPLSGIMRDFKSHTAKEIAKELDAIYESRRHWMLPLFGEIADGLKRITNYKVWQDGNHPILLTKKKFMMEKMEYIYNNPVAEEIVAEPEHYLYSSAGDYYCNKKGFLDIEFVE